MNTIKKLLLGITTSLSLMAISTPSYADMSPHMKQALVSICKAAKSNSVQQFHKATRAYRIQNKTVAAKVVCNGEDIISFAQIHGAHKTALNLEKSIADISATEIAANTKLSVQF